jgi:hypothetical protein
VDSSVASVGVDSVPATPPSGVMVGGDVGSGPPEPVVPQAASRLTRSIPCIQKRDIRMIFLHCIPGFLAEAWAQVDPVPTPPDPQAKLYADY